MASELKPCGGCGATSDRERCIGCLHDFGAPESAWVRTELSPGAIAIGKIFHGDEGELDDLTQSQRRTLNIAAAFAAEAERNTRPAPAATDTGLETVGFQCSSNAVEWCETLIPKVREQHGYKIREVVTRSQAEELLAAERAEKEIAERNRDAARENFLTMQKSAAKLLERAEKAEADNAALTARVKALVDENFRHCATNQGIEAKLADATELLREAFEELSDMEKIAFEFDCMDRIASFLAARAALEDRP